MGASGVVVVAAGAAAGAQQSPPQDPLVSQQKRFLNSRCKSPSRLQVSQEFEQVFLQVVSQGEQLQVMLLKHLWCKRLTRHLSSLQGEHALLVHAGWQAVGWQAGLGCSHAGTATLRQTLTCTSSGTQTATLRQTVQGTVSHTV